MAQANIGPKLVDPFVEILDPPPPNMITISPDIGGSPSGVSIFGGSSALSLTLLSLLAPPAFATTAINVNLAAVSIPRAPVDVGNALVAALPAGFSGEVFVNPPAFNV